jgi:hypothetical protein
MKIASSPTQIAAQAMATSAQSLRPQAAPRRIQTADLVELTKQSSPVAKAETLAAPVASELQTSSALVLRENQSTPTRPTRPGALLDIKV